MILQISYILLFIFLVFAILKVYNNAMLKQEYNSKLRRKKSVLVLLILGLWILVQYLLTNTGFYLNLTLPPRIPLFMIFPLLLFTAIFLSKNKNSKILANIPIHIPIFYQSFRVLIEILFYFTFIQNILPKQVTFEGSNYDVLLGLSAVFIGIYACRKKASIKVLIAWNILGIAVVLFAAFIFITSFYFPSIWGSSQSEISPEFGAFPFLLLPAFFMPSAIFFHFLSIVQLRNKLKHN